MPNHWCQSFVVCQVSTLVCRVQTTLGYRYRCKMLFCFVLFWVKVMHIYDVVHSLSKQLESFGDGFSNTEHCIYRYNFPTFFTPSFTWVLQKRDLFDTLIVYIINCKRKRVGLFFPLRFVLNTVLCKTGSMSDSFVVRTNKLSWMNNVICGCWLVGLPSSKVLSCTSCFFFFFWFCKNGFYPGKIYPPFTNVFCFGKWLVKPFKIVLAYCSKISGQNYIL